MRTAFVKLLLVVKGVKSIKYYQVVTVDHILARLSEDHLRLGAENLFVLFVVVVVVLPLLLCGAAFA